MSSTRLSLHINAPRPQVYAALVDADTIAQWKVLDGMTVVVDGRGGTRLATLHEGTPPGVAPQDDEAGGAGQAGTAGEGLRRWNQ